LIKEILGGITVRLICYSTNRNRLFEDILNGKRLARDTGSRDTLNTNDPFSAVSSVVILGIIWTNTTLSLVLLYNLIIRPRKRGLIYKTCTLIIFLPMKGFWFRFSAQNYRCSLAAICKMTLMQVERKYPFVVWKYSRMQ